MPTFKTLQCENCGVEFKRQLKDLRNDGRFFCGKECLKEFRQTPENVPTLKGGKITKQCVVCGELYHIPQKDTERRKTCSMECRNVYISEWQKKYCWLSGLDSELHPNWKGGKSFEQYPKEFFEKRKLVLERDGKCVECNNVQNLCVHHIDYYKQNNGIQNLIVLCQSCHSKTNYKRDFWEKRYKEYAI